MRLERRLSGMRPSREFPVFCPTPRQVRRLKLLLAILDLFQLGQDVSSFDVARQLVYPKSVLARGMEWKSSSERRRTLRLIEQARRLTHGGYRDLLMGVVKG